MVYDVVRTGSKPLHLKVQQLN